MAEEESEGDVLDFTGFGLDTIEVPAHASPIGLIYDENNITTIENIERCRELQQLSLASNKIVRMVGVSSLLDLSILNLANNSIVHIEGLDNLTELTWLDLSGNKIKTIENLSCNVNLRHLDLSDNNISAIGDLSALVQLKTLLLHENLVSSLKPVPTHLSPSINVLSLESNNIYDLYEICHLSGLMKLQQLSLANNPCVDMTGGTQYPLTRITLVQVHSPGPNRPCFTKTLINILNTVTGFDYRPFVVNWCFSLQLLDGYVISEKERLQAEWLYSQGEGHHFSVGEHDRLVDYLALVCPLTASDQLKTQEDAKLSRILAKQQYHHRQLELETRVTQSPNITVSDDGQIEHKVECPHNTPDPRNHSEWGPVKAWTSGIATEVSGPQEVGTTRCAYNANDLTLQDVSADDFDRRSSISLLDSESVYLPVEKFPQNPQRPSTTSALTTDSPSSFLQDATRPDTAIGIPSETKYEAYDRRMIRPLNQEILKGTVKPNFEYSPPQTSGTGPLKRTRKQTPPTAQGQDYDTSMDNSVCDESSVDSNADKVPPRAVSLIRDIAGARKAQKTIEERKALLFQKVDKSKSDAIARSDSPSSSSKSNIPVLINGVNKAEFTSQRFLRHKNSDTKSMKSRINHEKVEEMGKLGGVVCNNSVRDSGFLSRPCSDAVLADATMDENKAAVTIQSLWRGHFARQHDAEVVSIRKEIRARRAEDHIVMLKAELEQQRQQYAEEKKLRTLQMEAIKTLWQEVQSLQSWKNEVLASQSFQLSQDSNRLSCSSNQRLHSSQHSSSSYEKSDTNDRLSDCTMRSAFSPIDVERQRDLEKTCASLQAQVLQLQKAFESLPNNVFSTSSINLNTNAVSDVTDSLRITCNVDEEFDQSSHLGSLYSGRWSIVPHSLSPYPSEEEENYFCQIRQFGVATPPRSLKLQHKGENSVILTWTSSKLVDENGKDAQSSIIGYRVYINDQCKALVPNNQLSVAAIGLDSQTTYKFYIKALSALGESYESNIIMAKLAKVGPTPQIRPAPSSDSDLPDDSDKDHDSTETMDRKQHRKRENRKTRRVKSPRSEKQKLRSRSENTSALSVAPSSEHNIPVSEHYRPTSEQYRTTMEQYGPTTEQYRLTTEHYRPSSEQYRTTSEHYRQRSAKIDPEAAEAIFVHPKLHLHRGSRYQCDNSISSRSEAGVTTTASDSHRIPSSSSQSSVSCSPVKTASNASVSDSSVTSSGPGAGEKPGSVNVDETKRTFIGMSETYTLEQSSFFQSNLQNITNKIVEQTTSQLRESHEKAHKRSRSKDRPRKTSECTSGSSEKINEMDIVDDSSLKDPQNQLSRSPVPERKDSSGRGSDGSGSESHREGRHHGHQRKRSKDLNIRFDESSSSTVDPNFVKDGESSVVSKPVLDGRKRHSSGSRPNSPMVPDSFDTESSTTVEKRRINVADALEQRLQNIKKSSSFSASDSVSNHPTKHRQLPVPNVLLDDGTSESVRSSHRHHSSGSEGDIPLAVVSSSKQDSRSLGTKLLQKLEAFTKSQEKSVREGKRKKRLSDGEKSSKLPSDDEKSCSSRERRISDSDGDQSSDVSGVPPRAPSRSDGSSGSHSDEGRSSRTRRTHRRTPSGGAIIPNIVSDLEGRPTHSPIIMEGGAFKKSSTSVRRHASFHGLLPSKHQDSKLGTSPSDELLKPEEHGGHGASNQEALTKSQRRLRSRTPSPSPATHQPVISASNLQKSKTSPS
ncbi:uncharacterized protein LOC121369758 [Gigantopelta aegis]|uniref:uncharacterized protein LOC121369758 n=1 Tax=Gigantopelta aegis TaxID=1735272 RepID=UPI001B88999E|nr:uncharacterized protein LOC121369758 [Gigantopelta aegis]